MRHRIIAILMMISLILSGCQTEIKPDSKKDGTYSTQTSMSSLEYSLFMNKQITVFANQLSTRMAMVKNDSSYENEISLTKESLDILKDAQEEVIVTKPPETANDDREAVISAMDTAIEHMEWYLAALRGPDEPVDLSESAIYEDITQYADLFQNDFNALTSLATLYYQ